MLYIILAVLLNLRWYKTLRISNVIILFFIIAVSINILVAQSLHFLHSLDNPVLYLIIQLLFCAIGVIIVLDPARKIFKDPIKQQKISIPKHDWIEWILIGLIGIVLATALYVGTLSPINNSDSLHTHLPRIFYWLQHGSLQSWFPVTVTQLSYPINISLQGLWLFLLSGSELTFFMIMWLALVVLVILVYQIARLLDINEKGALISALVSLSFPVLLLQTYSYQGDVFVTALVIASVYFLLSFRENKDATSLYASAVVFTIALGSKQTAFLFIPIYVLGVMLVLRRESILRKMAYLAVIVVISFGLFSSFKFIQNSRETQVSDSHMISPGFFNHLMTMGEKPVEGYMTNSLRYLYQAVSFDGIIGQTRIDLEQTKTLAFRRFSNRFGINLETPEFLPAYEEDSFSYDRYWPTNEDASWFGPLSISLIPLSMLLTAVGKNRKRSVYLGLAFLTLLAYSFGQVVLKGDGWGANRGRHMMISALTLAPLVGVLVPRKRILDGMIALIISLISISLSISILFINDNRPLITTNSLYNYLENRIQSIDISNIVEAQYVAKTEAVVKSLLLTSPDRKNINSSSYYEQLFYQSTEAANDMVMIKAVLTIDESLYLYIEPTVLEYALFGENRTRQLYPVHSLVEVPQSGMVLVDKDRIETVPATYEKIDENENYYLLRRR